MSGNDISNWPVYSGNGAIVKAVEIASITTTADGQVIITPTLNYVPYTTGWAFFHTFNPEVGGYLVVGSGDLIYLSKTDFESIYHSGEGGITTVTTDNISDAGTIGKAVLKSITSDAALTALGKPTSTSAFALGNMTAGGNIGVVRIMPDAATASTIVARTAAGAIVTGTPTGITHATTKAYVDALKPATAVLADNATKLATSRAITLTGDVTGTVNFDGSAAAAITAAIGAGVIVNADVAAAAAIVGTKIVTAAAITSAGGDITIPAGTTLDAALKIIADFADPTA